MRIKKPHFEKGYSRRTIRKGWAVAGGQELAGLARSIPQECDMKKLPLTRGTVVQGQRLAYTPVGQGHSSWGIDL